MRPMRTIRIRILDLKVAFNLKVLAANWLASGTAYRVNHRESAMNRDRQVTQIEFGPLEGEPEGLNSGPSAISAARKRP